MKRITHWRDADATKIFLMVLMAATVFGQAWDRPNDSQQVIPAFDKWVCVSRDSASGHRKQTDQYIRNINAGDSVWTTPFKTRAYMDIEATVVDTAATDSVILYMELWQGNLSDSAETNFSKTDLLSLSNRLRTITTQDSITTTGIWYCDLNLNPFRSVSYSRLLIYTGDDHSISNGVKLKIEFSAPPSSETGRSN